MARKAKEELEQENDAKGLYAYADFEVRIGDASEAVKKGDRFDVPHGWRRDLAAEELMQASRRKRGAGTAGMIFVYEGKIVNPNEKNPALRERQVHTAVLPLEER